MELALVTISGDYRPVLVYDLTDGTRLKRRRDTTRLTIDTDDETRATLTGTWVVHAQDATELSSLIDTFVRRIRRPGRYEHVEWRSPPSPYPVYLPRLGPGTAQVVTTAYQHALYRRAVIEVSMPVEYPPRGLCMDVRDDFDADSRGDFTFDAGTSADVTVAGTLAPAETFPTERRARHTARGYATLEAEGTVKFVCGVARTGFKAGRTLRASPTTYVEVYADDDGTNSRLRIDVVLAGARTNRATINLAARLLNATNYWVRGRIEGNTVYAEFFTTEPTPMGAPANATSYTLAGGEIALLVPGHMGFSWVPQDSTARLDDYRDRPFTWRNRTLPAHLQPSTEIPGSALALADFEVTPSGGSFAPIWAMLGWNRRPTTPLSGAVVPFGILQAEAAGDLAGWAVTAEPGALGGFSLNDATPTSAKTYTASWTIDPSTLDPDELHARELVLDVYARVFLNTSLVTPRLTLSARPAAGVSFGQERFTREHGPTGMLPVVPAGDAYRTVRLGSLILPIDPREPVGWKLWLAGSLGPGTGGAGFALDYLWAVAANRRVRSPVGLARDAAYPDFVKSTTETRKLVMADGSGAVATGSGPLFPDVGLSGPRIELSPGQVDLFAKLSNVVVNNPSSLGGEVLSHPATFHARVIPRFAQLRGV